MKKKIVFILIIILLILGLIHLTHYILRINDIKIKNQNISEYFKSEAKRISDLKSLVSLIKEKISKKKIKSPELILTQKSNKKDKNISSIENLVASNEAKKDKLKALLNRSSELSKKIKELSQIENIQLIKINKEKNTNIKNEDSNLNNSTQIKELNSNSIKVHLNNKDQNSNKKFDVLYNIKAISQGLKNNSTKIVNENPNENFFIQKNISIFQTQIEPPIIIHISPKNNLDIIQQSMTINLNDQNNSNDQTISISNISISNSNGADIDQSNDIDQTPEPATILYLISFLFLIFLRKVRGLF